MDIDSTDRINRYGLLFLLIFYLAVNQVLKVEIFSGDVNLDGFYNQINYASKILDLQYDLNPLFVIHVVRLISIFPFYIIYKLQLPEVLNAVVYLVYLIPFFWCKKYVGQICLVIFMLMPIVFSYRSTLAMCSLGYLYLILKSERQHYFMLLASAVLANLSSGTVLSWGCVVGVNIYGISKKYPLILFVIVPLALGLIGSIIHKWEYMFSFIGQSKHGGAIERSTLFVSYHHSQNFRFVFYLVLFSLAYIISIFNLLVVKNRKEFFFFVWAIPAMMFEGVGAISFLFAILIYLTHGFRVYLDRNYVFKDMKVKQDNFYV